MPSTSRFSHHARRALTHAGLLVNRYHHPSIDTGHLLVGVMLTTGSIGYTVLDGLNLDADSAWLHLESIITPIDPPADLPPNEKSLDTALDQAANEAAWLGHHYIGTGHLLLGITRTNEGNVGKLLNMMNVVPDQVLHRVRRALNDGQTEYSLQQVRRNIRLSELSRRVINAAEQLSISLDHETVGLGHLLLVLHREHRCLASSLLNNLDETRVQQALDAEEALALTSIEAVLRNSVEQAQKLGSHYTGTEHLLLSLLADSAGFQLAAQFGIAPKELRQRLEKELRDNR